MARRYYSSTAVATTLSASANNSDTSITVTALSGYPVSTPWTAIIDPDTASEEVVEVTNVSGTTLTVTRGVDGTSGTSHSAGAVFRHGVSARDFDEANAFVNGGGVANSLFANKGTIAAASGANTPAALTVGADGKVLKANSATSTGLEWGDDLGIPATLIDAKGDLIVGSAADTAARLAVGATDGHVLQVDSNESAGMKWAAAPASPPSSSRSTVATTQTTSSTSYTDLTTAGPTVTLTTGTKALVIVSARFTNSNAAWMSVDVSGATTISPSDSWALRLPVSDGKASYVYLFDNLTAGSNTFTAKYRAGGSTGSFANRDITVIDMGS